MKEGRRVGALAMKVGMLAVWDKWGVRHPATVLHLDGCEVVQVKTQDTDGYYALQLGVGELKPNRINITTAGHFAKYGVSVKRKLMEFQVTPDALLPPGTKISAMHFVPGQVWCQFTYSFTYQSLNSSQLVDVSGTSKGKGFQGVMKRWNFGGGPATHGNSLSHRVPGSTGCRQDPGRVFKNKKMPGKFHCSSSMALSLIEKLVIFFLLLPMFRAYGRGNNHCSKLIRAQGDEILLV